MTTERTIEQSFWSRVIKSDGCWEWGGYVGKYGYGQFAPQRGVNLRAHKVAWELTNGPVPPGLVLDHLCRNRSCVRPDHLEPVTQRENAIRGIGPSAVNASKTECDHGHEFTDRNTKFDALGKRVCRECRRAIQRRYLDKLKQERSVRPCGAKGSKTGEPCKRRVSAQNPCPYHPVTVLWEGGE